MSLPTIKELPVKNSKWQLGYTKMVACCPERNPIKVTFLRASDANLLPTLEPLRGKILGVYSYSQSDKDGYLVMVTDGSEAVLVLDAGEAKVAWFQDSGCTLCPWDDISERACRRYGWRMLNYVGKRQVPFNFSLKELRKSQSAVQVSSITVGLRSRIVLLYLYRALQALDMGNRQQETARRQETVRQRQEGVVDQKVIDFNGYDISMLPPELRTWKRGETRIVSYFEDQPPYVVTYLDIQHVEEYLHEIVTPDTRPIALDLEWFVWAKPQVIDVYQMCQGQRVLVIQDTAANPSPVMREFLSSHSFYSKGTDFDKKMLQSRFGPEFFVDMEDVAETRLRPYGESINFTEMAMKFGGRTKAQFKSKKISVSNWSRALDTRQVLYAGFDVAALSACYPNFPPKIWDGGDILFDRYQIGLFKTSWLFWDFGLTRQVRLSALTDPYSVTLTRVDDCSELSSFATGAPIGLAMFESRESESSPVAYLYAFCQGQRVVVVQDDQPQCSTELKQFLSRESGHVFIPDNGKRIRSRAGVPMSFAAETQSKAKAQGLMSMGRVDIKCHGRLEIVHVLQAALRAVHNELRKRDSAVAAEENNDEPAEGEDEEEREAEENNDEPADGEDVDWI